MELNSWSLIVGSISVLLILISKVLTRKAGKLPPGPTPLPLVGNIFQLGKKTNESLFHLAKKYGPLMTLQLGFKTTVVVSSPAMAREVLKVHDKELSSKTVLEAAKCLSYSSHSMIWSDCVPRWRTLKKICTMELFTAKRLDALQHLRREQVTQLVRSVYKDSVEGKSVDISHEAFLMGLNLLGNMIFSRNMFQRGCEGSLEFKDTLARMMVLGGKPNLADFFPILRFLDPQGITRGLSKCFGFIFGVLDKYIEERQQSGRMQDREKDFLDILLESKTETGHNFTSFEITRFFYDIFTAGTETASITIEWAIAELIRNPQIMKKVKEELDSVVGLERLVEEGDIAQLHYLHAVIKEVLRLHPPAPILGLRKAKISCEIMGYKIPKDIWVVINVWAIGRDPSIWQPKPEKFFPERFFNLKGVEYKGNNFELIPFGSGRRMCPGLPLADRMVHICVATLVQCFDWYLPNGQFAETLNMSSKFGITVQKEKHLVAIPIPRLPVHVYDEKC
ncbi:hypothetical protein SUGI_0970420 [Cryptomeria japonica]|nr:hypothetical protein SUGI_0970420 [Cryptomeria japonica]